MKIDMKIGWLYRDIVFGNGSERWILSPGEQKPYEDEYCAESQVHRPATTKKIFYFVADDEQQEQQPPDVPAAMRTVIAAMKDDPEYAWSWHCNVAMAFVDEGGDRYTANQAAARFMRALAGVEPAHELPALAAAPAPHPDTADAERWRHVWQCVRMAQHGEYVLMPDEPTGLPDDSIVRARFLQEVDAAIDAARAQAQGGKP